MVQMNGAAGYLAEISKLDRASSLLVS